MNTVETKGGLELRNKQRQAEDSVWINEFLAGNEHGLRKLFRFYQPRLVNFVFERIGDFERAEDLVQETFLRIFQHIGDFDHSKKFSTWIYTIASNLTKNELRNRSLDPLTFVVEYDGDGDWTFQLEDQSHNKPDQVYRNVELRVFINRATAQLPEHYRRVFILREVEGRSSQEIANMVGCTRGTVTSRIHRARVLFAKIIEPMLQ